MVRNGEIACNKQFLLFSQCFLHYVALIFHFKYTLKCRLQFVSIWSSLKFVVWKYVKESTDNCLGHNNIKEMITSIFLFSKYMYVFENPLPNG